MIEKKEYDAEQNYQFMGPAFPEFDLCLIFVLLYDACYVVVVFEGKLGIVSVAG